MSCNGEMAKMDKSEVFLNTYSDHRIAMSFSILALKNPDICIENPGVVEKSFPGFWKVLENLGIKIDTYKMDENAIK